ncbi:MAG: carbohydrate ABC transporter permease [Fusobacteriota bacterium]
MSKKKKQEGLNEKQLALVLILPAIISIAAVAFYPVIRTFWLSMFDLQLNNPSKSSIHLSEKVNMERFTNTNSFLRNSLYEIKANANKEELKVVNEVEERVNNIYEFILEDPSLKANYTKIEKLLLNYEKVPDDLKYHTITANQYEYISDQAEIMRKNLMTIKNSPKINREVITAVQLVDEFDDAIIESNFVGLSNYSKYLKEPRMYRSLLNTLIFTFGSVFAELILGIITALIINKPFKGRALFRAAVLIPWAIPTAISAMMWKFMYNGEAGILAAAFAKVGLISDPGALLTTADGAMFGVIFSDVWKTTPYMALLLFAGLQQIPDTLYEAADVDGASPWQQFRHITLPLLKPAILVALLFRTLDAFRVFDLIYILTGGGPANGTETISIYAYKTMFSQMRFGEGSALSFIVFVCIAIISTLYIKILGAEVMSNE